METEKKKTTRECEVVRKGAGLPAPSHDVLRELCIKILENMECYGQSEYKDLLQRFAMEQFMENQRLIPRNASSELEAIFIGSLVFWCFTYDPLMLVLTSEKTGKEIDAFNRMSDALFTALILPSTRSQLPVTDAERITKLSDILTLTFTADLCKPGELPAIHCVRQHVLNQSTAFHISFRPTFDLGHTDTRTFGPDLFIWVPVNPEIRIAVRYHKEPKRPVPEDEVDTLAAECGFQVFHVTNFKGFFHVDDIAHELADFLACMKYGCEPCFGGTVRGGA